MTRWCMRIADHKKEIGLKTAGVMVKIEAPALAAMQLGDERLQGRHVEFIFGKSLAEFWHLTHFQQ